MTDYSGRAKLPTVYDEWKTKPGDPIADIEEAIRRELSRPQQPFVHVVSPARYQWLCAWHDRILRESAERAEFERRISKIPGALALARRPFMRRLWRRWQEFRNRT